MALFCPAPHPGSTPKVGLLVLGGWCSTGVYGGGRDSLGGRERFNGWSPLSILLLAQLGLRAVVSCWWRSGAASGRAVGPGGPTGGSTRGNCPPLPCCSGESEHPEPSQVYRG